MDNNQTESKRMARQPRGIMGGRGGMMRGPVEKPRDFKGTLRRLIGYLSAYRIKLGVVLIFAAVSTVFTIVGPKILGGATNQIVDDYVAITAYNKVHSKLPKGVTLPAGTTGATLMKVLPKAALDKIPVNIKDEISHMDMTRQPTFHYKAIMVILVWLVGLYILSSIFMYAQSWLMTSVTQDVTKRFRRDISHKVNRLPLSYFDKQTYGEVLSRITNDVDTVGQTLNQSLSQIVTSVITLIGIAVMMFSISWLLTLVTLVILPISFGALGFIMKRSQVQFIRQQQGLGDINGHIEEIYTGHTVMKVFNGRDASIAKFDRINRRLYMSAWKAQFFSSVMFPLMNFVGNLGYVGVSVVGGWMAVNGKLRIGDIQAFIQYVQQFNQPITQTANIMNVMQSTAAAAERVFEFLGEREESAEAHTLPVPRPVKGEVVFKNVVFGYDPGKPVIKHFSLDVKAGHRVAIVGPTGAGKTTLVNLLMRFYDLDKGSIVIDGVDIARMKRSDVRQLFGMVLQDTWLFSGTVRDNLTYGREDTPDDVVKQAVRDAHIAHVIRALPNGYDTILDEEATNISQGEKQLFTIARAMIANAPMLILDEATSSVDTRTEQYIQKAMEKLMNGKTSFVIAHRLSTIRDAHLILMVKDGNIVEQGTHEELLALHGAYAELYNSQFAGNET